MVHAILLREDETESSCPADGAQIGLAADR